MEEINAARVELDPWASAPDEVVVPDPDWSTPTTIGGSGSRYTSTATSPTDAVQRSRRAGVDAARAGPRNQGVPRLPDRSAVRLGAVLRGGLQPRFHPDNGAPLPFAHLPLMTRAGLLRPPSAGGSASHGLFRGGTVSRSAVRSVRF